MEKENIHFSLPLAFLNLKTLHFSKDSRYRSLHFHKEIELVSAEKGTILCNFENEVIKLSAGEAILINSNVIHSLSAEKGNSVCTYIQTSFENLPEADMESKMDYFTDFLSAPNKKKFLREGKHGFLYSLISYIKTEAENSHPAFELFVRAKTMELFAYMTRNKMTNTIPDKNDKIKKILPATEYINQNFKNTISLEKISEHTKINKYYLCKIFKEATGKTINEYINYVRLLEFEKQFLLSGGSVLSVATDCGFNSIQYFNRVFKSQKGCTPTEYKKLHIDCL